MQHPQIVVYESDGWLAEQVRELARENSWLVRESRQPEACLNLLLESRPAVVLLKLERKLVDELSLLQTLHERVPDRPIAVFSDVKLDNSAQRASLAGLAYDLGARYVMFPPLMKTSIEDLTAGLMEATIQRHA